MSATPTPREEELKPQMEIANEADRAYGAALGALIIMYKAVFAHGKDVGRRGQIQKDAQIARAEIGKHHLSNSEEKKHAAGGSYTEVSDCAERIARAIEEQER